MFSSRIPSNLAPNRLAQAVARLRAAGRPFIDLTGSNPTEAGFEYPADLLALLADPRGLRYAPHPFGLVEARSAVAAEYARRGVEVSADRIVLTASTSEAYSLLFKLLCDPGDRVLVPRPSYPLFDHLTRLDGVVPVAYDLEYHGAWTIDLEAVERGLAGARAILLVTPNNPTGSLVRAEELDRIAAACARSGGAMIADEVFADYEIASGAASDAGQVFARRDVLVFGLGGLSKSVGLPQVKLGWIAVAGPDDTVAEALGRLELASDAYLSVSTPVQLAAAGLLERGGVVRRQIQARVSGNYDRLVARGARTPACRVLRADAGWYAVVQVPALCSEEQLALELLERDGVLAHPGYFYDFQGGSHLVISLLGRAGPFAEGIERLFGRFDSPGSGPPDGVTSRRVL